MVWIKWRGTRASAQGMECGGLGHNEPRGDSSPGRRRRRWAETTVSEIKEYAERIIRTLREHGYQAYLVGGCVRDLLLGREPADYDVATDATPNEVMRIFPETYAVGAQFGVVLVPIPGAHTPPSPDGSTQGESTDIRSDLPGHNHKACVEVATFRCDVGYSDGRHPDEVRFS